MILEQIDLVDVEKAAIGPRQQAGLERLFAAATARARDRARRRRDPRSRRAAGRPPAPARSALFERASRDRAVRQASHSARGPLGVAVDSGNRRPPAFAAAARPARARRSICRCPDRRTPARRRSLGSTAAIRNASFMSSWPTIAENGNGCACSNSRSFKRRPDGSARHAFENSPVPESLASPDADRVSIAPAGTRHAADRPRCGTCRPAVSTQLLKEFVQCASYIHNDNVNTRRALEPRPDGATKEDQTYRNTGRTDALTAARDASRRAYTSRLPTEPHWEKTMQRVNACASAVAAILMACATVAGSRAADLLTRRIPRSSKGPPISPAPAIAKPVTPRRAARPTPGARRSIRLSGRSMRPISRPTRPMASAPGATMSFIARCTRGSDRKGDYLYPAFPYQWFTKVTRDDVLAIRAFLNTVPPSSAPSKKRA